MKLGGWKKQTENSHKNFIWGGLGLYLGQVWDGLGILLAAFGCLLVVFWTFKIQLFSALAQDGFQEAFWIDFGFIGWGFRRFWEDLEGFGKVWEGILNNSLGAPPQHILPAMCPSARASHRFKMHAKTEFGMVWSFIWNRFDTVLGFFSAFLAVSRSFFELSSLRFCSVYQIMYWFQQISARLWNIVNVSYLCCT